jgi:hypothetical protein
MYISERKSICPEVNIFHVLADAIIIGETSSPKVYRLFTLEDEYTYMTRDLILPNKTSSSGSNKSAKNFPGHGNGPRIDSLGPRTKGPLYNYICSH